jgi:trimethylguanosine synthase
VAVDAFAGAGGNAIQLAMTCARVVAVEVDPARLALLLANARVYGVEGRIEARCADFFEVAHTIKVRSAPEAAPKKSGAGKNSQPQTRNFHRPALLRPLQADVAFFSPPWGGPEYGRDAQFDPEGMGGDPRFGLTRLLGLAFGAMGCRAAAAWLPRNVALCALGAAAGGGACEVERALLNGRVKAVTAYYGELARDPRSRAAPARREGGGAGPAPEPGGGSEVDAQTEEPCAAGE